MPPLHMPAPDVPLEMQLAQQRATRIVGDVMTQLVDKPHQPMIAMLVAVELVYTAFQATVATEGNDKALRRLCAFFLDVNHRALGWLKEQPGPLRRES